MSTGIIINIQETAIAISKETKTNKTKIKTTRFLKLYHNILISDMQNLLSSS